LHRWISSRLLHSFPTRRSSDLFWPDVVRPWPHFNRPDIFESSRSRGIGGARVKGLVPLFLGVFGTFAFSWVGLTVIPNLQIGARSEERRVGKECEMWV